MFAGFVGVGGALARSQRSHGKVILRRGGRRLRLRVNVTTYLVPARLGRIAAGGFFDGDPSAFFVRMKVIGIVFGRSLS
jgi:hypothetical protein